MRRPRWLPAALTGLATVALVAAAALVVGAWAGRQVDAALSATIGPAQSEATGWVALATLLLCLGDALRQQLRRNP